jgi:hypothetical protein
MVAVVGLVSLACFTSDANAQCCGGATTAYYQPVAYTTYSPVVYQTYWRGWYPGYFADRIRARLWGAPSTYLAAYPTAYVASYPSTYYYTSYPTYTASYVTSYAPASPCATCSTCTACYSPCTTCATTQQVTLRPVCTTCCDPCTSCDPCSGCSSYGTYSVSQTSYEQPVGCGCGSSGAGVLTPGTQPGTPPNGGQPPQLPETFESTPRSSEKPPTGTEPIEAEPADHNGGAAPETQEGTGGSGAYFEAPQLFNPSERRAQRIIAPVRTALYTQPVGQQRISAKPMKVTAQQAEQDAVGWRSASR